MLEAKDILAAALKLNTRDRAHLVDELSASLEGIDLGNEWEDEIQRRIDDIDAGRVNTVPGDVVFSRLEQRFSGR
jgi:putative addiction module component (TIGR02574 family)